MSDKTTRNSTTHSTTKESPSNNSNGLSSRIGVISWNKVTEAKEPIKKDLRKENINAINDSGEKISFFQQLSQRFVEQQDQITAHRRIITKWFATITAMQLAIINVLVFFAIFNSNLAVILDFMKYFVGATFLELLGGLFIIVKFVFGHETSDMLKHLTYNQPNSKDKQDNP